VFPCVRVRESAGECAFVSSDLCLCVVVFNVAQRSRSLGLLPLSAPLSVPVCVHGEFRGFVAGRSDATSALDPGLGSSLLGTLNF
jgi:hypothetical protein